MSQVARQSAMCSNRKNEQTHIQAFTDAGQPSHALGTATVNTSLSSFRSGRRLYFREAHLSSLEEGTSLWLSSLHCCTFHWLRPDHVLISVIACLLLENRSSTRLATFYIHGLMNEKSTSAQCMPNNKQSVFSAHYFIF